MPVIAILELTLRPDAEDAPARIRAVLEQTRARPGCEGLEVVADIKDPNRLSVIERWESLDADNAYRAWRQTEEGASDLGELLAAAPVLRRYEPYLAL
jgi:heme oxygenase (mycobilin-producing)